MYALSDEIVFPVQSTISQRTFILCQDLSAESRRDAAVCPCQLPHSRDLSAMRIHWYFSPRPVAFAVR